MDFDNDFARNDIIFGVHSSSSSQPYNRKNNFLILGEGSKFCLSLHYNADK